MKAFYKLILVLLAGTAYGRDGFPNCPPQVDFPRFKNFNKCYGSFPTSRPVDFYEGEFLDGVLNGQGIKVLQNGNIKIGQWQYGALTGYGIIFASNKKILAEGLWEYDRLIETQKLDP